MSHRDSVGRAPEGFKVMASTPACPIAGMADEERKFYAVQFHPELDSVALKGWLDEGGVPLVVKDNQDADIMLAQTVADGGRQSGGPTTHDDNGSVVTLRHEFGVPAKGSRVNGPLALRCWPS